MKPFHSVLLAVLLPGLVPWGAWGGVLDLTIRHTVAGEPLELAAPRYRSAAGELLSFDRASYLLTGFALETPDGSWRELTNQVAWMDAGLNRTSVRLDDVPAGTYRSVRFHFGPDAVLNHAPATNFPARHPLNPNLNGLHWSWQGGYIFLALEGRWRNAGGVEDGWSYHLARDTNRVRINLPVTLDLTRDQRMELDFDLGAVLRAPRAISLARDGSSTHSRDSDPVAAALVANLPGAMRVRRTLPLDASARLAAVQPLYLPERWTAFPFTMSGDFPVPDLPRDNPLLVERVKLGERLFHDPRLSRDGTISCASCHGETTGFSDPRRFSVGVDGARGEAPRDAAVQPCLENEFLLGRPGAVAACPGAGTDSRSCRDG